MQSVVWCGEVCPLAIVPILTMCCRRVVAKCSQQEPYGVMEEEGEERVEVRGAQGKEEGEEEELS